MKRFARMLITLCTVFSLFGCAGAGAGNNAGTAPGDAQDQAQAGAGEKDVLNMAYQYGLAYAPLTIAQKNGYIESRYREATGRELEVVWTQMSSGADINTGIASGTIDVGFMGVGPAVTGVTKGLGYRIFTNLSGQEHGMMTNDDSISSLSDLVGSDKQIALVNIGAIQHVILGMALSQNGYDAHALDANLIAMKHPDGMAALQTGNVAVHVTSNPYIYKERDDAALHELSEVADIWSADRSFIVGVAAEALHDDRPELYKALCDGIADAIGFINSDIDAAAAITAEFDGNTLEDEKKYMAAGKYTPETKGVYELAVFMADNDFIDASAKPASYSDLVYDNVKGD